MPDRFPAARPFNPRRRPGVSVGLAKGTSDVTRAKARFPLEEHVMNRDELDRPDDFNVETMRIGGDTVLLALEGQVDLHTAPELRDQLVSAIEDGAVNVVVDLSDTTFIDSMTLGVLLGAVKRLRPRGGQLRVVCSDPNIRKIFEITLLDRVFALYSSREAAFERLVPTG
jgi:anti-sigma B factor antagonist